MLTFHEKYYLIIFLNNWIAAMRQKKVGTGATKGWKSKRYCKETAGGTF